nr:hypothetical protein [uncultured Rhodopila sp.]
MAAATRHGATVRATLCEIERGLFYTTFIACGPGSDLNDLPQYQVVATAAEARRIVEEGCLALGYATVIWADALVVPPSHQEHEHGWPPMAAPDNARASKPYTL